MTPADVRIRLATPEDTDAVCALLGQVFPGAAKARPEILRWQYWDNPFGRTCSAIAETDDGVVGHTAAFPIPGRLDSRPRTIAMVADAATHPSVRGRGVFAMLTEPAWFGAMRANDAPAVLVAPNPVSKSACTRGGMTPVADLPAWVRPVDPSIITARIPVPRAVAGVLLDVGFRSRTDRGLDAQVHDTFPDDATDLCAAAQAEVTWGVDPSPAWLRWRYADRPGDDYVYVMVRRHGQPAALAVCTTDTREEGTFRLVLEVLAADEAARAHALAVAVETASGCAAVALVGSPPGTPDPVAAAARRAGFRQLPRRLEPRPLHFGVVVGDQTLPDVRRLPWRLQWSFLDHL